MKNSFSLAWSVILIISDFVAVTIALVLAYVLRVSISHVPISQTVYARQYLDLVLSILPFWILIFALLGLYSSKIHGNRFAEAAKLAIGSVIGEMAIISYQYIGNVNIFPARKVVLYGLILSFLLVFIFRTLMRIVRRLLLNFGIGINRILLIGDSKQTAALAASMTSNNPMGDRVVGVVTDRSYLPDHNTQYMVYKSFDQAMEAMADKPPNTIVQTRLYRDESDNEKILSFAQTHHLDYRFIPGSDGMYVGNIDVELFHDIPMIAVHQTPLVGWGRASKRLTDIVLSGLILVVASPIMLLAALVIKLSDGGPVFLRQNRLTRFNRVFRVFKFRSHRAQFHGLSPEQAFRKLGRPELTKIYRANGDKLDNDPRITTVGKFIRKFSIDELPQLFNVLRGDLSLVGPRALVPAELDKHQRKHTILSVKSGLTGLAQISGRRNISFDERRKLDIYYVQNWSWRGDMVILAKTFWVVLTGRGAE